MLSPRTLALRMKNKVLLKALDGLSEEVHPHSRVRRYEEVGDQPDEFVPSHSVENGDEREVEACREILQKANLNDKMSTYEMNYEIHPPDRLLGDMNDKILKRKKFQDLSKGNTHNTMLTGRRMNVRGRSLSLEQQRSAEAQMHAPTHTHSMSKCYCAGSNNVKSQPDKRYILQLHSHKQHIPMRLKKQRYRADSISMQSRMVRWADSPEISSDPVKGNDITVPLSRDASEMSRESQESPQACTPRCSSSSSQHKSENSLLDKVKNFRKSHWYDCHASLKEKSPSSDHECVNHYVLNKRLFFEPLCIDERGQSSCPVCLISSGPAGEFLRDPCYNNSQCRPSHTMVTLPTVMMDPSHLQDNFKTSFFSARRTKDTKMDNHKTISCFCVAQHKYLTKRSSLTYPKDTLALRYQKKAQ